MSSPVALRLTDAQRAVLDGSAGAAAALAMRVVCRMAGVAGASRLRPITAAHIDGCIYFGVAMLDFAERLVELGARVGVPTTSNVGSIDLIHPELFQGDPATAAGARTGRYGDFIDICAAIVGLVPDAGLHRDENRRGQIVFDVTGLREELLAADAFYPALGHLIGREAEGGLPVIDGLPGDVDEDRLKALAASSASSGGVAMFHAVGLTPEAPTSRSRLGIPWQRPGMKRPGWARQSEATSIAK